MVAIVQKYQSNVTRQVLDPTPVKAAQTSAGLLGEGLQDVADTLQDWQDEIDTAQAKEADARYADLIREELYADETGFMYSSGSDAMGRREDVSARLESIYSDTLEGLSPAARNKARSAMEARRQSALQSIDVHTSGQRKEYLNTAANARVGSAVNDAIYDPGKVEQSLRLITQEVDDIADREGWAPEVRDQKILEKRSEVHAGIIERVATVDPIQAFEYLKENKGDMAGADVARIETTLVPHVKRYRGRQTGLDAARGAGDMRGAMQIASGAIGMSETEQVDALKAYLADGGQSLDPTTTAWCASFVNATLAQAGLGGTGSNMARSFLDWGQEVNEPQKGDVVVLSRGDPNGPYGHVGFFDGYNEDGTIRIMGGNQSDAVNVQSYDADQVLGFRRAPGGVTDDPASAMARLIEIEDPIEREAAIAAFQGVIGVDKMATEQAQEEAFETATGMITNGGSVYDMSPDQITALGAGGFREMAAYEATLRAGKKVVTDDQLYVDLHEMMASDPAGFMAQSPMEWRNRLNDADFDYFVKARASMRGDTDATPGQAAGKVSLSTIRTASKAWLDSAGVKKPEAVAAFETAMLKWETEMAGAGVTVTAEQRNQRVMQLLADVSIDPSGMGNRQKVKAFQVDYDGDPLDVGDDLRPEDIRDGRLRINGNKVGNDIIEQFATAFNARFGRAPTVEEVVDGLVAEGIYE